MSESELVEAIERLGDFLGKTVELANNLRLRIKKEFGYHHDTLGILSVCRGLAPAEEAYQEFHTYFLEKLKKKGVE
jgi:hypothetical protein